MTCREVIAGTEKTDDVDVWVLRRANKRFVEFLEQEPTLCVPVLGSVNGDVRYSISHLVADVLPRLTQMCFSHGTVVARPQVLISQLPPQRTL